MLAALPQLQSDSVEGLPVLDRQVGNVFQQERIWFCDPKYFEEELDHLRIRVGGRVAVLQHRERLAWEPREQDRSFLQEFHGFRPAPSVGQLSLVDNGALLILRR